MQLDYFFDNLQVNDTPRQEARLELNKIQKILDSLHWYDKKMFELYLQEGSYRKVEKLTKIGYNSVQDTVLKVRKIIKDGTER